VVWSRAKLEHVANGRLAKLGALQPVERAALAYARWQGLTDEADVDTEAAKRALDRALDELDEREPMEAWAGLTALAEDLGDQAIVGLMKYSVERGFDQVLEKEHARETQPAKSTKVGEATRGRQKKDLKR